MTEVSKLLYENPHRILRLSKVVILSPGLDTQLGVTNSDDPDFIHTVILPDDVSRKYFKVKSGKRLNWGYLISFFGWTFIYDLRSFTMRTTLSFFT